MSGILICSFFALLLYGSVPVLSKLNFPGQKEAVSYKYETNTKIVHGDTRKAVKDSQYNFNLQETRRQGQRFKRYAIGGLKWNKTHLTWRLKSTKHNSVQELIRQDLKDAFSVWQNHSVLTFEESNDEQSDIVVEFFRRDHGDGFSFDGPGGTLVHAFYPPSGKIHFDDDESFVFGRKASIGDKEASFFNSAVHGIGHSLGLAHSSERNAIMYAAILNDKSFLELTQDDIDGIQAMYVSSKQIIRTSSTLRPIASPPNSCDMSYDAILNYKGEVFIFKDGYVWRVANNEVMHGYPVPIRRMWSSFPRNPKSIDAVYENLYENIVFFSKQRFYEFQGYNLQKSGTLAEIGISDDIKKIDGIFIVEKTKETLIFSGEVFWKFDETTQKVLDDYPQQTNRFWNNVGRFDTVFQKNGITYFFKGLNFYDFDDKTLKLSDTPKKSAQYWMDCPEL